MFLVLNDPLRVMAPDHEIKPLGARFSLFRGHFLDLFNTDDEHVREVIAGLMSSRTLPRDLLF